jgi:hypothetical protein
MIPEEFIEYAFQERVEAIKKMLYGKFDASLLIDFTRHNAAIITYGPAGLNGSIKGIGFIHRDEFLMETLEKMRDELSSEYEPEKAGKFLLEEVYVREKIDFTKFITLELARKHTWKNLTQGNKEATILFFTPPSTSYEVRCDVEIHRDDEVWEYANSLHDIFHRPKKKRDWSKTPAYLFKIREIYDNSEDKMGVKIY